MSDLFALAVQHHQAGQLFEAEQLYQQLLQQDPQQADAWHLLGVMAHQQQQFALAAERMEQAIALNRHHSRYQADLGTIYQALGRLNEAATAYQQALTLHPQNATILNKLGMVWQQLGQFEAAIEAHQQAIQWEQQIPPSVPNGGSHRSLAFAYNNLGLAQQALNQLDSAAVSFQQALQYLPHLAEGHYNLGNVRLAQGQIAAAIDHFQQALTLKPNYIKAHQNLGLAYYQQHQWAEAESQYRQVLDLTINTRHESRRHAWHNLGQLYQQQGRFAAAVTLYQQAIAELEPHAPADLAEFYSLLGNVWLEQQQLNEAIACFERANQQTLHPRNLANLGAAYHKMGQVQQARAYFEQALQLQPDPILQLRHALTLPIIYPSSESVAIWRQRLLSQLDTLRQAKITLDPTHHVLSLPTHFLAAYQGYNDRDLQAQIASLYAHSSWVRPHSSPERMTLGFISAHFKHHTVGKLMQGFITKLPRPEFKVIVFSIGHHTDDIATIIRRQADEYIELSPQLETARQQILAQTLDLLFYADIGMEPFSYALGLSRLAPIQCVTWGHSVTSGLPNIDYYISSSLYESYQADHHYTEHLIRLKTVNTYFYRPKNENDELGMMSDELKSTQNSKLKTHHYLCPQSLYKYHPDFDALLGEILRRDPQGRLWLLSGQQAHWNELLWQRFETTIPDVLERIEFVPRQDQAGFLQLLTQADVILDPPHFGGCNSSLEAFAFGLPIVAMPSEFLRGRFTAGFYQAMGLPHLITHTPREYIDLAVRLGTDVIYRQQVKAEILAANHVLYENMTAVDELADFFRQAISLSRAQTLYEQAHGLRQQGQIDEAIERYRQVIDMVRPHPNPLLTRKGGTRAPARLFALAQDSLGVLLGELGQLEAAAQAFHAALTVEPEQAEILNNLGVIRQNQGQIGTAMTLFQQALDLRPDFLGAYSNLLLTSHYLPAPSSFAPPAWSWQIHDQKQRTRDTGQITIGYISPDFRQHPVAYFMQAILAHHHQTQAICYADVAHPDSMTTHLQSLAHQWRDIYGQSDDMVAAQIQADQVDILVELAGHTGGNRLTLLAQSPAPIQLSYLGYPDITGLPTINYRLTDRLSEGETLSAQSLYLPDCFLCYTPPPDAPDINPLPALTQGYVTFGSCNHLPKLNQHTLTVWAEILRAIPTARLLLKSIPLSDAPTLAQFKERLAAAGLPLDRVDLHGYITEVSSHLAIYHHLDIALDPFPYNGTTTTCETLWMGVPTITLAGKRHAGRVGVSLLTNVGLSEWIGHSVTDYINLAIKHAHDLESLAQYRATLRQKMAQSPLCDGAMFTRNLEAIYQHITGGKE